MSDIRQPVTPEFQHLAPSRSNVAAAVGEPVPPVSIENPILNLPFTEPTRHLKFDDDAITSEWVSTRGTASVTL